MAPTDQSPLWPPPPCCGTHQPVWPLCWLAPGDGGGTGRGGPGTWGGEGEREGGREGEDMLIRRLTV